MQLLLELPLGAAASVTASAEVVAKQPWLLLFPFFSAIFRCFCEFLDWDLAGPVRMHSDTFGCVWMLSDAYGHAQEISEKSVFCNIWTSPAAPLRISAPDTPI